MARNPPSDSSASSAKRQKVVIANDYVSELLPIEPAGLLDLPPEIQLEIFQYLDHRLVFTKLPLVCKQLNNVIKGYSIPLDEITIYVGWSKTKLIKLSERLLGCRKVTLSTRENCFSIDRLELMKPELMKLLKSLAGNVLHLKVQTGSFLERSAVQQQIFQQWVNEAIFENEESKKLKMLQHFKNDWDWKWQPECQSVVEVRLHFGTYFNLPEMFRRLPSLERLVLRDYERIREWSTVTSNDLQNVRILKCHNFLPPLQQNVVFNNVYKLIFISIGPSAYFRQNIVDQLHSSFPHLTDLDITFHSYRVKSWFYGISLLMYALHSQLHHLQLLKLTRQYPEGKEFEDEDYDDDLILHLRNLPARISRIEFAVQATIDGKILRRVLWNRY
jgi:hypothetical protein